MITQIKLQNFKCFNEETQIKFSRINILYGKNGRGKSTILQPLLLISQNIKRKDSITETALKGSFIDLGTYSDVVNRYISHPEAIKLEIKSDIDDTLKLSFGQSENGLTMLHLEDAWSGQRHLISNVGTEQESSETKASAAMSGIKIFDFFRQLKYVSAGRRGPVNYEERQDDFFKEEIGANGDRLINALSKSDNEFKEACQSALSYIFMGGTLKVADNIADDRVDLLLDSIDNSNGYKPTNVGFGYSFVLPIIFQLLSAEHGSTIIIENPEAHLYPGAQSRLVEWIISTAVKKNLQIILETHSDHIINGVRISVKKGELNRHDALIQFIDRIDSTKSPNVTIISMDQNGTLSDEPADFMDEWTRQMLQLL